MTGTAHASGAQGGLIHPQFVSSDRPLHTIRGSIAAEEYQAAQQWVDRQTSALRDAAHTEVQYYRSSIDFGE